MGLGRYQEITTLAKSLGGVDELIKSIEVGAVAKAAPGLVRKGVMVGAGITGLVTAGVATGTHFYSKYKEREIAAAEAKVHLKEIIEESMNSDAGEGPTGAPDDVGDEN